MYYMQAQPEGRLYTSQKLAEGIFRLPALISGIVLGTRKEEPDGETLLRPKMRADAQRLKPLHADPCRAQHGAQIAVQQIGRARVQQQQKMQFTQVTIQ